MIYESSYWKEDLLKTVNKLAKKKNQKKWSERSYVSVEKDIFLSFYSIRKLIEAHKITSTLTNKLYKIVSFESKGKNVTLLNCHKIDELYDLNKKISYSMNLKNLCNLFIHSYVFTFYFHEKGIVGIFVNSDFSRNKKLYRISLELIISILKQVGEDDPNEIHYEFDKNKKDYIVNSI